MIRHGSISPCTRTAALRVTTPYAPFSEITVADASSGHVHLSGNRMMDRQDAPSASNRTFPVTDRGTLKTNPTTKFPQAAD